MNSKSGPRAAPLAEGFEPVTNFSPLYRLLIWLFLALYGLPLILHNYVVFGLRIEGRKNLGHGSRRGRILVSNHSLYLDPAILIQTMLPRRSYYTGLQSHFRHPLGGALLRLIGGIPIPDQRGMKRAENTVRQALDLGICVHFFPEGEMTHLGQQLRPFRMGAFYLAVRLQAPIVPIAVVHHPRKVFGRTISRYFIRVKSVVGVPIEVSKQPGETNREAAERLSAAVRAEMMATISGANPSR